MKLSVIIPVAHGRRPDQTLQSLADQTRQPDEIIIVQDKWRNANAARNAGFEQSSGQLLLFCDDDITWRPHALEWMEQLLEQETDKVAGVYPAYIRHSEEESVVVGAREYDEAILKKTNYITTMTLLRAACFPGWDPNIQRLQDWDLWLTIAARGYEFLYAGEILFETSVTPDGITSERIPWHVASAKVKGKHKDFVDARTEADTF